MLYLLAVACPPLAVLIVEGVASATSTIALTCLLYVPGMVRAFSAVARYRDSRRNEALLDAVAVYDRKSGAVAIPAGA